jgi:tRNA (guanine-N7-)-methyltransferase
MAAFPESPLDLLRVTRDQATALLNWRELFENDRPVELEIGSGKGLYLAAAATQRPGHNFVGVDLARKYAKKTAERIARLGLSNVRVFCDDGRRLLVECVPSASLVALHVYFPDPWWKQRHKKRRLVNLAFADEAARVLTKGAVLHLATDVEEYFGLMRTIFAQHQAFLAHQFSGPPGEEPAEARTSFERKYRIEGRAIYRASYSRV